MPRPACISRIAACSSPMPSMRSAAFLAAHPGRGGASRPAGALACANSAWPCRWRRDVSEARHARTGAQEPDRERPDLSAGHARHRAPRPSGAGQSAAADPDPDGAPDRSDRARETACEGRRRHHPAGRALGPARHQVDGACFPISWPRPRLARPAPSKPGWWTPTATSPKAPRPRPGSWTRTGQVVTRDSQQRHPARRHPAGDPGGRGREHSFASSSALSRSAEALTAPRGLHHGGHTGGHAGDCDRRAAGRRGQARPDNPDEYRSFTPTWRRTERPSPGPGRIGPFRKCSKSPYARASLRRRAKRKRKNNGLTHE